MRRILSWALLIVALLAVVVVPLVAYAQFDGTDGTKLSDEDIQKLIWLGATSVGQFLVGLAIKKWPKLDWLKNRFIPYVICAIATVGYVVLLKMDLRTAFVLAGFTSYVTIAVTEGTPLKTLTEKPLDAKIADAQALLASDKAREHLAGLR